jgi:hypothetical protein
MEILDTALGRLDGEVDQKVADRVVSSRYLGQGIEIVLSQVPVKIEFFSQEGFVVVDDRPADVFGIGPAGPKKA